LIIPIDHLLIAPPDQLRKAKKAPVLNMKK